jgi:hypothetical protein
MIEASARAHGLPVSFFTRLIWRESSFRTHVTSRAGAQGVAQFMPGTAAERGLVDPFDPEQAIPKSAHLLADHVRQFGNIGLAAAAYNGGPGRVAGWLAGKDELRAETRSYVIAITGLSAEQWAARAREPAESKDQAPSVGQSCLQQVASLRRGIGGRELFGGSGGGAIEGPLAPWGVQIAGNFSKSVALASFARARAAYSGILGEGQPMIIGTRMRSRGMAAFYRVRMPAQTRAAANQLCDRLRRVGGSCVVLRS